jgi:hypothetical protein
MNIESSSNKITSKLRRKMLCLVRAKACKRCGGDLSIECDVYGVYIECIQCGATLTRNDLKLAINQNGEKTLKAVNTKPLATTVQQK